MIVLDTHALIWWVHEPTMLSPAARDVIDEAATSKGVCVSCISAWEITMLVARGRLQLALDVRDWLARCEALPFLSFHPVDCSILVASVRLPDFPHADPADRIIAATALSMGTALVTKDEKLRTYPPLKTVW